MFCDPEGGTLGSSTPGKHSVPPAEASLEESPINNSHPMQIMECPTELSLREKKKKTNHRGN